MSLSERLIALHDLHVRGLLTDDQYTLAKARVIQSTGKAGADAAVPPAPVPLVAPPPPPAPVPTLNPVVPGVGLALGAAAMANGGLTG